MFQTQWSMMKIISIHTEIKQKRKSLSDITSSSIPLCGFDRFLNALLHVL
jgi:hypothetical protein